MAKFTFIEWFIATIVVVSLLYHFGVIDKELGILLILPP